MTMFPIHDFEKRFRALLAEMDALRDGMRGDGAEEMDELNANFEDALFVIECIDDGDADWIEAFSDALDEFDDLAAAYRALSGKAPAVADAAERLDMAVQLARAIL